MQARARPEVVPLVHQSVLAGILACAELVKRSRADWKPLLPTKNLVAWNDVTRSPPHGYWLQAYQPLSGCICGDDIYRAVYAQLWAGAGR